MNVLMALVISTLIALTVMVHMSASVKMVIQGPVGIAMVRT